MKKLLALCLFASLSAFAMKAPQIKKHNVVKGERPNCVINIINYDFHPAYYSVYYTDTAPYLDTYIRPGETHMIDLVYSTDSRRPYCHGGAFIEITDMTNHRIFAQYTPYGYDVTISVSDSLSKAKATVKVS